MEEKRSPEKSRAFHEILRRAGQAVGKYRMIRSGDKLLLGVSGGKDSLLLAHVLKVMQRRSPVPFELELATFDPGFPDFGMPELRAYCERQEWKLHVVRLEVGEVIEEKGIRSPCMMCARLRRGKLYGLAAELGCNRLVLAQHLDDAVVSFLMSLTRGQGLTTMGPNVPSEASGMRIIRPLVTTPEALIIEAVREFEFPKAGKCAYAATLEENGDRAYFTRLLATMSERIPHIRSQVLRSMSNIQADFLLDETFLRLP